MKRLLCIETKNNLAQNIILKWNPSSIQRFIGRGRLIILCIKTYFQLFVSVLFYILLGTWLSWVMRRIINRILFLTTKQPCIESSLKLKPVLRITFSVLRGKNALFINISNTLILKSTQLILKAIGSSLSAEIFRWNDTNIFWCLIGSGKMVWQRFAKNNNNK